MNTLSPYNQWMAPHWKAWFTLDALGGSVNMWAPYGWQPPGAPPGGYCWGNMWVVGGLETLFAVPKFKNITYTAGWRDWTGRNCDLSSPKPDSVNATVKLYCDTCWVEISWIEQLRTPQTSLHVWCLKDVVSWPARVTGLTNELCPHDQGGLPGMLHTWKATLDRPFDVVPRGSAAPPDGENVPDAQAVGWRRWQWDGVDLARYGFIPIDDARSTFRQAYAPEQGPVANSKLRAGAQPLWTGRWTNYSLGSGLGLDFKVKLALVDYPAQWYAKWRLFATHLLEAGWHTMRFDEGIHNYVMSDTTAREVRHIVHSKGMRCDSLTLVGGKLWGEFTLSLYETYASAQTDDDLFDEDGNLKQA